jgi:hypothetical protein
MALNAIQIRRGALIRPKLTPGERVNTASPDSPIFSGHMSWRKEGVRKRLADLRARHDNGKVGASIIPAGNNEIFLSETPPVSVEEVARDFKKSIASDVAAGKVTLAYYRHLIFPRHNKIHCGIIILFWFLPESDIIIKVLPTLPL